MHGSEAVHGLVYIEILLSRARYKILASSHLLDLSNKKKGTHKDLRNNHGCRESLDDDD